MAHFNFVISQNAKWGHAGFYIDCHRMTVPENILLQKKHWTDYTSIDFGLDSAGRFILESWTDTKQKVADATETPCPCWRLLQHRRDHIQLCIEQYATKQTIDCPEYCLTHTCAPFVVHSMQFSTRYKNYKYIIIGYRREHPCLS